MFLSGREEWKTCALWVFPIMRSAISGGMWIMVG